MKAYFVEIWDGQQWQRLPEQYRTSSAAGKVANNSYATARVVRATVGSK